MLLQVLQLSQLTLTVIDNSSAEDKPASSAKKAMAGVFGGHEVIGDADMCTKSQAKDWLVSTRPGVILKQHRSF